MKNHIFLVLTFISTFSYTQLSDLHYLPPLKQGQNNQGIESQAIYLSTPEITAFTVNVYQGTNPIAINTFNVSNAAPVKWSLTNGDNNIILVNNANTGTRLINSGLRFEAPSGKEFYVNYRGNSDNQAASLTSKGRKALGTNFKWGGVPNLGTHSSKSNTLGIMATEDGTTITLSGYDSDCEFRVNNNRAGITADIYTFTLDANESFVFETYIGNTATQAHEDGWIGASIISDKDIAISNGSMNFGRVAGETNRDAGIDQPVPINNIGKEYVFVRGNGVSSTEFPLIIATADNTQIFVNGATAPIATIDNGEYYEVPSSNYSTNSVGGNMFVTTSKDTYAYQCLAGDTKEWTTGLNFVAPVNCLLPDSLSNIPDIRDIAGTNMDGGVTIIASVNTPDANIQVTDNGGTVTLPASSAVAGSLDWKTFYIPNLNGNVSVSSTGPMAIGFFGFNGNKGVAGYYSGFDTVPEVILGITGGTGCFPGSSIFEATANFDAYQWYGDGILIPGATSFNFAATVAGDYYVRGTKGPCTYDSEPITVFYCDPDVIINKTVDKPEITEGETATFTIRVENFGIAPLTNLRITDNIPAGLTLINAATTTGTWNGSVWDIGTLNSGTPVFLELEVQGNEISTEQFISITNTVTNTQDQVDANITEDISSSTIIVHNDFDNDGVNDNVDLDDDNDGIYDTDECSEFFCFESIINESFEDPIVSGTSILDQALVPGWFTTATDSQIEIWESGSIGVDSYEGNQHAELNANENGGLYQNLCLTPGTEITWSLRHRGREGEDEMRLRIGADIASAVTVENMRTNNTEWVLYSGIYTVPAGQNNTVFLFESVSTASGKSESGNFIDDIKINIVVPQSCVDTDGDGFPDNIDLDSDNDGCNDAIEYYSDNNVDGGDGGEFGTGIPVVDPTDGTVIAASYTQVFAPEISLENTSEDLGGTDINGDELLLGQNFNYVLRFQNIGSDNATNFTIRDILPSMVTYVSANVSGAPGVLPPTHDAITNELVFTIPDNLVEVGDPEYELVIEVTISNTSSSFVNACSENLENLAYITYQDITNINSFSNEPGVTATLICGTSLNSTAINSVLADLITNYEPRTSELCGDFTILSAGTGFTSYIWRGDLNNDGAIDAGEIINDGDPDGDPSTLVVTTVGNYTVEKSGATGCADFLDEITVSLFGETQTNPITSYFNRVNTDANPNNNLNGQIATCSNDNSQLPQIFLCGANDDATIQTGITDANNIVWQLLDETSCADIGDECANVSSECSWSNVGSGPDYTITDSGKYRVVINYINGCSSPFYFNVYKNILDITPVTPPTDIICSTPGNIRLPNIPNYGYQLVEVSGGSPVIIVDYAANNGSNFDITTAGIYVVQVTPLNPSTDEPIDGACVFETDPIGISEATYDVNLNATAANCAPNGSIEIQALNVLPDYIYELRFANGDPFQGPTTPSTDNTHTFTGLPAGEYTVITTTTDGCTNSQNIEVEQIDALDLTATAINDITCNAGLITLTPSGGEPDPNYKMAIWRIGTVDQYTDPDPLNIPDADFQTTNDFLFLNDTDAGDYVFVVVDSNDCYEFSNTVTINYLGSVVITPSHTNIICSDSENSTLTVNVTGGTAPYQYSLDGVNFQSLNTFTNLGAGFYTITVKDSSGTETSRCIESYVDYEIIQPFRLNASAAIVEDIACDPATTLVKILNPTGGQLPYEYSFNGGTTGSFSTVDEMRLTAGNYTLVLKDALGCTFEMPLTVPSAISDPGLTPSVTYDCNGEGTITVTSTNTTDFEYTYTLNSVQNTPADSNVFSNVPTGTQTVTVGYSSSLAVDQSTLLYENFGTGITTSIEEIGPGYCYEAQNGNTTNCSLGPDGIFVNGEYAVTNAVNNSNSAWRSPNDYNGETNGRFLAIGISTLAGNNNVLWQRNDLEVIANQDITFSFFAYNIVQNGQVGDNPEVLVQLLDASGNIIDAVATTAIDKNNNADDWHRREVTFNSGANTVVDIVIRTNLNSDDGNLIAIDEIQASQQPIICEKTQNLTVEVLDNQSFSANVLSTTNPTCNADSDGSIRFEVSNFDLGTGYEYSFNAHLGASASWTFSNNSIETTAATLADGTYTITLRRVNDNTCTTDFTVTLTEPDVLAPTLSVKAPFSCIDGGGILEASATGGTLPYEYQLETSGGTIITPYQTMETFTSIADGDYLIRVRDDKGCIQLSTTAINITEIPVTFDTDFTTCYDGLNNATITASVTSGNGDYTFRITNTTTGIIGAWQTPETATPQEFVFDGLSNGTYTIEVDDSVGCGPISETVIIAPVLTIDVDTIDVSSCTNGSITVTSTGGRPNLVYAFVTTGTTVVDASFTAANMLAITSATTGDYDVYVRDNSNIAPFCEEMRTVTVNNAPVLAYTATATNPECHDETGSIAINITSGVAPYIVEIVDLDNAGASNQTLTNVSTTSYDIFNLMGGEYHINITDTFGCVVTETRTIVNPDELTATIELITPTGADCSTYTNVDFGFDFENYPTSLTNIRFSDDGGATLSTSAMFRDYPSGTTVFPTIVTVDGSGNIICQTDLPQIIIPFPLNELSIDASVINFDCTTLDVQLEGSNGTPGYEFSYSSDPTNFMPASATWTGLSLVPQIITGLSPGRNYTFYVRDANGCIQQTSRDINDVFDAFLEVETVNSSPSCNGSATGEIEYLITENVISAGTDIEWTLFDTTTDLAVQTSVSSIPFTSPQTITVSGIAEGTYYIEVNKLNGASITCTGASGNEIILELDAITGTPNSLRDISCAQPGLIEIPDINGGGGMYTYTITGPVTITTTENPIEIPANSPTGVYNIQVVDQYGCPQNLGGVPLNLSANPQIDTVVVSNCDALAQVTVTPLTGVAPILYSIDGGTTYEDNGGVFTNVVPGSYTVSMIDSNGCTDTESIVIAPKFSASAEVTGLLDCVTTPNAEITISVFDGVGPFEYEVTGPVSLGRTAITTPSNSVIWTGATLEGDYTIFVYDTGTMCNPIEFERTVKPVVEPEFSVDSENVSCSGAADGYIQITEINNSINPLTYTISPIAGTYNATTKRFENLPGGTYTITAEGTNACTTIIPNIVVNELAVIDFNVAITPFGCTTGNTDNNAVLSINTIVNGSGTYSRFVFEDLVSGDIQDDESLNTYIYTNKSGGDVEITVYDDKGCFRTVTRTITGFDELESAVAIQTNAITCLAGENVDITTIGSLLGTNPTTYEVSILNGATLPIGDYSFTGLTAGTYTFVIRNPATGCEIMTSPYVIAEPNTFDINLSTSNVICEGDNGSVTFNIIDANYTGAIDYEVFDTKGTLITSDDTSEVIVLGATGSITEMLPANDYRVVVTQSANPLCKQERTFTITTPDAPITLEPITTSIACSDSNGTATITPIGGVAPYIISITHIGTSTTTTIDDVHLYTFHDLDYGTYDVTVTDALGCIAPFSSEFTLVQPGTLSGTIHIDELLECEGDTDAEITFVLDPRIVIVDGANVIPNYNYRLYTYIDNTGGTPIRTSTPQTGPTFNNLAAGFYSIYVTDDLGCFYETTPIIEIVAPTEVEALLSVEKPIDCSSGADLLITASGGTGPYTWSATDVVSSFAPMNETNGTNTHLITNQPVGIYTYFVMDSNSCVSIISNEIPINSFEDLTANVIDYSPSISCAGVDTGFIIADAEGGFGEYEYALFSDSALTSEERPYQASGIFADLPSGIYYLNVQGKGDCAIISPIEIEIESATPLLVTPNITQISCANETDGAIVLDVQGGTELYQYSISPNLDQFINDNEFTDLAPGDYTVFIQDSNGCLESVEFEIEAPTELRLLMMTTTDEICFESNDGTITLDIDGGTAPYYTSLNSDADVDFNEGMFAYTGLESGFYTLYIKDANGCQIIEVFEIKSGANLAGEPIIEYTCDDNFVSNTVSIAFEDSSILDDVIYGLDTDDPNLMGLDNSFENLTPGEHFITVLHSGGCPRRFDFTIGTFEPLELELAITDINTFTGVSQGGAGSISYISSLTNETTINGTEFYITETGTYPVTVMDENGCTVTKEIFIEFIDIEIPNFFTPDNKDGLNDTWLPKNMEQYPDIFIKIYDRYGRELYIFQGNQDTGWDGTYQLTGLPTGDYWYVIKLNGIADKREFIGNFTLYR